MRIIVISIAFMLANYAVAARTCRYIGCKNTSGDAIHR